MKQIRRNVFETNSSSTHSICISKAPVTVGKHIYFGIGEYGWENDCVDIVDYLYTAILDQDDADELLEKLKDMLDKNSIEYDFEKPKYKTSSDGKYKWLDHGYVDHSHDTRDFINAVLSDDDMLMRCLFGNSCVYTGNDNQDCCPSGCNIADEIIWEYEYKNDKYVEKPNPYHDPENYDYFYKGN
jgi:hypothetical protein